MEKPPGSGTSIIASEFTSLKCQQNDCIQKCLFIGLRKDRGKQWIQIRLLLQEQSNLDQHCLSKRLQIFQQMTKAFLVICTLIVNKCEFSV